MNRKVTKAVSILSSILASAGVIATGYFAAKSTPAAIEKIKSDSQKAHGDPNAYTKKEAVKSAWAYYIWPVAIGTGTVLLIAGNQFLNKSTQQSLAGAYMLMSTSYKAYQDKVKDIFGEHAHEQIVKEIKYTDREDVIITDTAGFETTTLDVDVDDEPVRTFYDTFSKRYFEATLSEVLQAEYHLNRNFVLGWDPLTVNNFYEFLGLEPMEDGDNYVWDIAGLYDEGLVWIDFAHRMTVLDDGMEVLCIDIVTEPIHSQE